MAEAEFVPQHKPSKNQGGDPHILKFKVIKCSSFSAMYEPFNILVDCPADQASRWSSESNNPPQFLVLELDNFCVLHKIVFGKYEKTHVCNLKKFKIFAGPTEESMAEVLDSGLRNDHQKETFTLKNTIESHYLPVKYVKIVPLQSWGNSFNFSIWYVELHGDDSKQTVDPVIEQYKEYREHQAIRLCLKHFRQHNYMEAFQALQKKTKVSLEDPLLDRIHNTLVQKGDYESLEEIIIGAAKEGMFNHYVNQQDFYAQWSKIEPLNRDGSDQRPGQRGGHQMVIDPATETLYLFGGWDGRSDLADFWSYHVPTQLWTCISVNTEEEGGPSARSCHKMIIDHDRRHLFVLGCYLDSSTRTASSLKSGFYAYDIDQGKWIVITEDTYSMGGPRLLFDHQMCIDMEHQTIYVCGGKVQGCDDRTESNYSGLYSYHIPTNRWRKLRGPDDDRNTRSRFGHSMQFDQIRRQLYVYAGQRGKEFLNDFYAYDVDNDTVQVLAENNRARGDSNAGPPAGFTQRATIDTELGTIHILLGLNRQQKPEKPDKEQQCQRNVLWLYDISSRLWSSVSNYSSSHHSNLPSSTATPTEISEPSPRFAHQLVYDHVKKIHYMFGGNPGSAQNKSMRLDDFWSLTLCRPSKDYVIRRCKYLIRKHRFRELACVDAVKALRYLQNDLHETIDHENKKETAEFQKLTTSLFSIEDTEGELEESAQHHETRSELYGTLVQYFPPSMTEPSDNLIDMIPLK